MAAENDVGTRKGSPRYRLPLLPRLPHLPTPIAAALAGLVCGVVATALVWGGQRGCDAVRGRPTCGGYGVVMLVAIIVVCYLVGVVLLKAFNVDDPGVTAFFGVALPLLVVLGLLLDDVFEGWMAVAIPVLAAVCFILSACLARALEAADPNPYVDDRGERDVDEDDEPGADAEDDLPSYAPNDER